MKMNRLLPLAIVSVLAGCSVSHEVPADKGPELNPAATATARGTLALIKLQNRSGTFDDRSPHDAGITALAGLALLSANDVAPSTALPHIQSAVDAILSSQNADGYYYGSTAGGMYGHAFATIFLTQFYASATDAKLKSALETSITKALHLIEVTQNRQGGWRYNPAPADADADVTAAQLEALVAAKGAGFAVSAKTVELAVNYLKLAQQSDGGFAYSLDAGGSSWPRSAAATAALLYSGTKFDSGKALAYLNEADRNHGGKNFYYSGNYYYAQALTLDPAKGSSATSLRAAILAKQDPATGLWTGEAGDAYATAIALIILYMPDSHLPAFKAPAVPLATQPATAP